MFHRRRCGAAAAAAPPVLPLTWLVLLVAAAASAAGAEEGVEKSGGGCRAEVAALRVRVAELEAELEAAGSPPRSGADVAVSVGVNAAEELEQPGTKAFYRHAFMALGCVVLAALAAGLTMGLVSIEPMEMKIIVNTEDKDMLAEKDKLKLKDDQAAARKVLPLIQDHHRLLVTLLLMNSIANEALPLFLDKIVPAWLAVIMSVSLVLIFGEILPSAVFTGSEQLKIASMFAPLVGCCQFLLAPIAMPIAKTLDVLLGEDHKGRYNFAELRAIVGIHANLRSEGEVHAATFKHHDDKQLGIITTAKPHHFTEESVVIFTGTPQHPAKSTKLKADGTFYYVKPCNPLVGRDPACTFKLYSGEERDPTQLVTFGAGELESGSFVLQERDEIKIMHGVMKLTHMSARDGIKSLSDVHMLESGEALTRDTMTRILDWGHSRLPVYRDNQHNVRGFVLTKKMIILSPDGHTKVEDLDITPLVLVNPEIPMLDLLNKFQADRCHIALVTSNPDAVRSAWDKNEVIPPDVHMMGIITLEDIIELLIQEDIYDEQDGEASPGGGNAVKVSIRGGGMDRASSPGGGGGGGTVGGARRTNVMAPKRTSTSLGFPIDTLRPPLTGRQVTPRTPPLAPAASNTTTTALQEPLLSHEAP